MNWQGGECLRLSRPSFTFSLGLDAGFRMSINRNCTKYSDFTFSKVTGGLVKGAHPSHDHHPHHLLHALNYTLQFTIQAYIIQCILALWQVIFDDQPTQIHKKKSKVHNFCTICTFPFYSFLLQSLISRCRMSKSSTATAPKISTPLPAKSA